LRLNARIGSRGRSVQPNQLREAVELYISSIVPLEASLMLRVRRLGKEGVREALETVEDVILAYVKPRYIQLSLAHAASVTSLKAGHPGAVVP